MAFIHFNDSDTVTLYNTVSIEKRELFLTLCIVCESSENVLVLHHFHCIYRKKSGTATLAELCLLFWTVPPPTL